MARRNSSNLVARTPPDEIAPTLASQQKDPPDSATFIGARVVEGVFPTDPITSGKFVGLTADRWGRQLMRPFGSRSECKRQATTISATGATTIVAAAGAGKYRDLIGLIITTAGAAAQTIVISDGTTNHTINYPNAAVAPGAPFVMMFPFPLPAANANTAWTANQSAATACNYLALFVDEDQA